MTGAEKICYIVAAGDTEAVLPSRKSEGDCWMAADAGLRTMRLAGITPDLFIGDGDSLGEAPDCPGTLLPKVKDDTDTMAAVRCGLEKGYRRFCVFGGLGGSRFSHSVANVQMLKFLSDHGAFGILFDRHAVVRLLRPEDGVFRLPLTDGYFSLFAFGGDASVAVRNAAYEGENIPLTVGFPLGVSNEPRPGCAVAVRSGDVLLVCEPEHPADCGPEEWF